MSKKLVIVLSSVIFPVTMGRFFWEAFERREDCEVHMIGPYFGSYIPWKGGINLEPKYVKVPDIPLPKEAFNVHIHPQMVIDRLPKNIDLFVQFDSGWRYSARPPGQIVAVVQTDPHVIDCSISKAYSDFSFCMQTPYMKDKDVYLPYAVDQVHFYPEDKPMVHDAVLLGLQYEQRNQLVNKLRATKLNVFYETGIVFDDYRNKYNESKVSLCWSSLLDLPSRVWETFGMARPLVVNRNIPDLHKFFKEEEHFLGFDSVEEGVCQVKRLLADPEFADRMRWAAYQKILDGKHFWDSRVQTILETCGLIE